MTLPTDVDGVISRMRAIDASLPPDDGVAIFNRVYLIVTEQIGALLAEPVGPGAGPFANPAAMTYLDIRFANLWLGAYDAAATRRPVPRAWRPLFEARGAGCVAVQYVLAGMNSHIEHDLPIAVVDTCREFEIHPDALFDDYEAVNGVLALVESRVRRSFLDDVGRGVDDRIGPVVHLVSTWNIDKARDLSWVTVQTIWALGGLGFVKDRFLDALSETVGMTSRALLTPVE